MHAVYKYISRAIDLFSKIQPRVRAFFVGIIVGINLKKCGRSVKIRGSEFISVGCGVSFGDFCWIEAVRSYSGVRYRPRLIFGKSVSCSDFVHISCVDRITIGNDVLIGSNVYMGDHSHGSTQEGAYEIDVPPAARLLGDVSSIFIGDRVWICDGAIVLAGSEIAAGSIVAANSVVRLKTNRAALIGGVPAKIIKFFD